MTVQIIRGNALDLPLADASVDLVVTSPPYFGLRSYSDGGEHYAGQLGSEATPAEFVAALLAATREMVRVLKPSGSIFVNLGDKYAQDTERSRNGEGARRNSANVTASYLGQTVELGRRDNGVPRKSLIGIPWRYALACIDDLGLILRAEIIWSKPNGLPESVTDRVRRSHETWFHFTREPRYYAAVDEVREPQVDPRRSGWNGAPKLGRTDGVSRDRGWQAGELAFNPLGKLPGSVWSVPTQPLTVPAHLGVDHFAAFPSEWPRRIILGWSPSGICTACGQGRRPVVAKEYDNEGRNTNGPQSIERRFETAGQNR